MVTPQKQTVRQDPIFERKYERLYTQLAVLARAIVKDSTVPAAQRYAQLKTFIPGYWGAMFRPITTVNGVETVLTDVQARCIEFNGRPRNWFAQGVAHAGTEIGHTRALEEIVIRVMKAHVDPRCELFLDLGCGWGHRMFDIWGAGIARAARFVGGDRSDASRDLVTTVATLFPLMNVDWFRCDLLAPDFAAVAGTPRHITLMTCAAIEQVKYLGATLFDRLFARFPDAEITGIHIEPVTFQFGGDYPAPNYVDAARDRAMAVKRGYNMDLYAQVKAHPRLSIAAVEHAVLDTGRGNSYSLLVWRTRARV
jgi:hypothetical protein